MADLFPDCSFVFLALCLPYVWYAPFLFLFIKQVVENRVSLGRVYLHYHVALRRL